MLNKVELMGRFAHKPELRHTGSGTAICSFDLAVRRTYGEDGETDFIKCVAWREKAEFVCRNFEKGQLAVLTGKIHVNKYSPGDGVTRYRTEVDVEEIFFCEKKRSYEELIDDNEPLPFFDKPDGE